MDNKHQLENSLYRVKEGMVVISNRDSDIGSSITINDYGMTLSGPSGRSGINIEDTGVTIQGELLVTGYGASIKKSHFSENPNGSKLFTETETLAAFSEAEEKIYQTLASQVGSENTVGVDGFMPIITDIGGVPPHTHSISMKHVHRVEPQYLYRKPKILSIFNGFADIFSDFISS